MNETETVKTWEMIKGFGFVPAPSVISKQSILQKAFTGGLTALPEKTPEEIVA